MHLHQLLRHLDSQLDLSAVIDSAISSICEDSRRAAPGSLFVARLGSTCDGSRFIADAKARGAAAVVVQHRVAASVLPQIVVKDAGAAASVLANALHGWPARVVKPLAVTGTNGKTTVAYLVRHLLSRVNLRCGMIGTVEIDDGKSRHEASMTTPAACDIADLLASMRDNGCRACVMEASSHALDQGRVAGVGFAAAAFTNLTGDHLDYHKTMENYAAAKARLFAMLDPEAVAVVNADDAWSDRMIEHTAARVVRYGFGARADYRASDVRIGAAGSRFHLRTPGGQVEIATALIGRHNIENVLAAVGMVAEACGLSIHQISTALSDAGGAPGRLQSVRCGQPFAVLVDYAHTDDALENVLSALRPLARGKLRVLFGCGGDRDPFKRPRMAAVAEKFADALYVTSDNPRTEQPQGILDQIAAGLSPQGTARAHFEIDRRAAIEKILSDAQAGDVVLLAGKGHENYQIIGRDKRHFDDVEEAARCLQQQTAAA